MAVSIERPSAETKLVAVRLPFVEMPINSGPLRDRVLGVRQGELVGHARIP
jgi:hypothetical protein